MADDYDYKMSRVPDYGRGNIDLNNRPVIRNPDGSVSTVYSMTVGPDHTGSWLLLPGVRKGLDRVMTEDEAIRHFMDTKEHLGVFPSQKEADSYAQQLHENQAKLYPSSDEPDPDWSWFDEDGK